MITSMTSQPAALALSKRMAAVSKDLAAENEKLEIVRENAEESTSFAKGALVEYPDSDSEHEQHDSPSPAAKKRKISKEASTALPPLPPGFLDQYSSTVRASTQDDPSLHGGRKRVAPHVQGNWPAHVYLEWYPAANEYKLLSDIIDAAQSTTSSDKNAESTSHIITSLCQNDLGVALPLHISLSRPLMLKTEQKDDFLLRLQRSLSEHNTKVFNVQPKDLALHPNENKTRWFLVLRLQAASALAKLLDICNGVAQDLKQPLLYAEDSEGTIDHFHISIAWSLYQPHQRRSDGCVITKSEGMEGVPYTLLEQLARLKIPLMDVKIRIGQDVSAIPFKMRR